MDKVFPSADAALADVADGATVFVGGFGSAGVPEVLVRALARCPARDLTIVSNGTGEGESGLVHLFRNRQVRRILASFPAPGRAPDFEQQYMSGEVELELVPQGTLAERIRAGGAGVAAFYTPTAVGTPLAEGKEQREFGGRVHLLEHAIRGDYALIRAHRADPWGNVVYRKTGRNFNPMMAMAADTVIAEVDEVVPVGKLDNERIETPGLLISRLYVTRRETAP
jgi:3-oxoadipate CoA-transferase alpha subunit